MAESADAKNNIMSAISNILLKDADLVFLRLMMREEAGWVEKSVISFFPFTNLL
jgi:hypothetical protein